MTAPPDATSPTTTPTLAAIAAKLDALLTEVHEMRVAQRRFMIPTEIVSLATAARRFGKSEATLRRYVARGALTDAREPGKRGTTSGLVFYADEIEALRVEGENGVARLRKELGRD